MPRISRVTREDIVKILRFGREERGKALTWPYETRNLPSAIEFVFCQPSIYLLLGTQSTLE